MIIFKIWTVCRQSRKIQMIKALTAMLDVPAEEATLVGHLLLISSIMATMTSHEKKKIHIQDLLKNSDSIFWTDC